MAESIPAPLIIDTLKDTFREARAALAAEGHRARPEPLGWVLSVPDTHQKTVLAALDKERALRVLTCATEDEAAAVAAGLYIGGEPVVLMIQHAGLYASVNTLRGVAMDGRVPMLYMVGLLSREKDKDPRESRHRAGDVRLRGWPGGDVHVRRGDRPCGRRRHVESRSVVPAAVAVTLISEVAVLVVLVVVFVLVVNNGGIIPLSHLHAVSSLSPFGCRSLIPAAITPSNGASIPVELVWKIIILMPLPPPRGASAGLLNCIIS